jgi:hypothetical protein
VLYTLEKEFRTQKKTGVLFLLSTEVSRRHPHDIYTMESAYNWPVAHRENWPDMSGGEASFYTQIQEFNARSRNIKIIFINQFGFTRKLCGMRMPQDIEFVDIRMGSDVEFGQSIYEPFGIAQLESLTFGGICIISDVCGCAGFLRDVTDGKDVKNIIVADYTSLRTQDYIDIEDMLAIDRRVRTRIEASVSEKVAMQICSRLPTSEAETAEMLDTGYKLAENMSWSVVVNNYLLKTLTRSDEKLRTS